MHMKVRAIIQALKFSDVIHVQHVSLN